jgi:hypothetical protein
MRERIRIATCTKNANAVALAACALLLLTGIGLATAAPPPQTTGLKIAETGEAAGQMVPELPGRRLGFVVTSFYYAMYQGEDACPSGMQPVPTTKEFLAGKSAAERERLLLDENKRELYSLMVQRGPNGENLCNTPWAVSDAPLTTLSGDRNDGLDIDGWQGADSPPPQVCPQKQYIGENGQQGIDNQLGRIYACLNGYREKGTLTPYFTQAMRDGMWSMLIDVSGIQDIHNDPDVIVDVYAGQDTMAKDAAGNVLAGASLAPLADPRFHRRMHGRITNGVLETTPIDDLLLPDLMSKSMPPVTLTAPRFQLNFNGDGTVKGFLGGYRALDSLFAAGISDGEAEAYMGFTCEGLYHALRRYADGNRDAATGACDQISTAYRIEAIPAFIVHPEQQAVRSFSDAR